MAKNKRGKNAVAYRDSKTGRFVSKATYNRSRVRGGRRYRRSIVERARRTYGRAIRPVSKRRRAKKVAYLVSFAYQPKQKGSKKLIEFDIIVGEKPKASKAQVLKTVEDIAFKMGLTQGKFTWLLDVLSAVDDEDVRVDPASKEKPPRKGTIKIRSVRRGGEDIYGDDEGEE